MKPTEEQARRFWEWCGVKEGDATLYKQDHSVVYLKNYPPVDLNNLFKWAVPRLGIQGDNWKLVYKLWGEHSWELINTNHPEQSIISSDKYYPALALFWAIWKVIDKEEI